jgi:hypothetical protein
MTKVTIDDVEGLRGFVEGVRAAGMHMQTTARTLKTLAPATFRQAADALVRAADDMLAKAAPTEAASHDPAP